MKAIILSVGDELVLGQTVDTNSAWISQQLASRGIAVAAHVTVGDDQHAIEQAIREAAQRAQFIIVSGGIGPTDDDLTRQALAAVMDVPLELNETWMAHLEAFFTKLGRRMPETNRIQAMIPRGATMIENTAGTAAGLRATLNGSCEVFVMPGVPKEMKVMFARDVLPHVSRASGGAAITSRTLHTFGLGESWVAEQLGELMQRGRNPSVGTTVANGVVSLRINARFENQAIAETEASKTVAACREKLGEIVFGEDLETLPQIVARQLLTATIPAASVATAESCTGGLLAKMLTDISGSSAYFRLGWVTYSNEAKAQQLGVRPSTLEAHGAVSIEVAREMAAGALSRSGATYALSITGIAGPTGGTPAKPVGTVCIGLASQNNADAATITARQFTFSGDREMIRDRSAKMALSMLRFHLSGIAIPF